MEEQEKILRFNLLNQEISKIDEQTKIIEEQEKEFSSVKESLKNLEKNPHAEILASLGKGIFIKTKVSEKELHVNVGREILVKKNIAETISIIEEQLEKLKNHKENLTIRVADIQQELRGILESASSRFQDSECDCASDCGDNCKCGKKH